MFKVTTSYKSNAAGRGQIVAKARGKQRTVNYDQSKSSDHNHGTAAGTVLLALGHNDPTWPISHDSNDSGTVHTFIVHDVVVGS